MQSSLKSVTRKKVENEARIARTLEPYQPFWLEDFLKPDSPQTLAQLKRDTGIPICGS